MTRQAARALASQGNYYLRQLAPSTSQALLDATQRADVKVAVRALENGDTESAARALLSRESVAILTDALTMAGVKVMLANFRRVLKNEVTPILRVRWEVLPPSRYTINALETLRSTRVVPLVSGSEEAVRQVLIMGQLAGEHPDVTARWAREAIGLSKTDVAWIDSFEQALVSDPAAALGRTLRDARYDGTLRKAAFGGTPINAELRGKMVAEYESSLRAMRAETYSNSTTLDALRQGQASAWADAAEANGVSLDELVKTWITTLDGHERDTHHEMHGTTIPFNERYDVPGLVGGASVPGENEYNCRCAQTVRLLPAGRSSRAEFLRSRREIAAEQLV